MNVPPVRDDVLGWIAVVAGTIVTLWTIGAALYWTFRPGERDPQHPKRLILKDDR
ncbi:MAG: hypothetical protein ABI231_08120 [Candidatus Tumulicola sp.]